MATLARARAELCRLRQDIARIEGRFAEADRMVLEPVAAPGRPLAGSPVEAAAGRAGLRPRARRGRLSLGAAALDRTLEGGLPLASLHEVRARFSRDAAAAAGFVMAVLARLGGAGGAASVVWISEAGSRREAGRLYAPGLAALGLDPGRIVHVAARTPGEALWAFEAALACKGLGAAICETRQASLDLGATRRCALRARDAGVTGFLLRLGGEAEPSAAELRFRLAPAAGGPIGAFGQGVGRMAWNLALERNRGGRTGQFNVEWNAHERSFAERPEPERLGRRHPGGNAGAEPVPAAALDRPPHPAAAGGRAGEPFGDQRRRAS